jgi:hypothetical protein
MIPYDLSYSNKFVSPLGPKATLNQLLGTSGGRGAYKKKNCSCHTRPNSTTTRGGGKTNRYTPAQGCWPLGIAGMPAIAKRIHREDPAHILDHEPQKVMAATCHHSPKRDERKNKHMQVRVHEEEGGAMGRRIRPRKTGSLVPGVWEGGGALCTPCSHDPSPTSHLRPPAQPL